MNSRYSCIVFLLLLACQSPQPASEPDAYLFSYFQNNGEDGLHLAYSHDGLSWTSLNDNQSLLAPRVGESQLMRDPCIIQTPDGTFHMVWTAGWTERGIGYAHSKDLLNWSEQRYLPVMQHEPDARNCWAPELSYDEEEELFMVYWATTIPGRFPESDPPADAENGYNHRMYFITTRDFETLSETQLLYDDGFNVIDATIHRIDGEYVMFLKDETRYPEPAKNLRIARSDKLTGPYGPASAPITLNDEWVEGPTAVETPEGWVVYFDRYRQHQMGAIRSRDLKQWESLNDQLSFPEGTRHGTVFKVNTSVLEGLMEKLEGGR